MQRSTIKPPVRIAPVGVTGVGSSTRIQQGTFGDGSVILTGIHPEAPESWRLGMTFTTPASASQAYAVTLIDAALNRRRLPHF